MNDNAKRIRLKRFFNRWQIVITIRTQNNSPSVNREGAIVSLVNAIDYLGYGRIPNAQTGEQPSGGIGITLKLKIPDGKTCYIQTFPPEFVFVGAKTDIEQAIGNAVPVKMAEYIGTRIINYMREND